MSSIKHVLHTLKVKGECPVNWRVFSSKYRTISRSELVPSNYGYSIVLSILEYMAECGQCEMIYSQDRNMEGASIFNTQHYIMFGQITGIETPNVDRDEIGLFSYKLVFLTLKGPLIGPSRASRGQTLESLSQGPRPKGGYNFLFFLHLKKKKKIVLLLHMNLI